MFASVFAPKKYLLMVSFNLEDQKHVFLKFYCRKFLQHLNKRLKGPRSPSNAPESPKYLLVCLWFLLLRKSSKRERSQSAKHNPNGSDSLSCACLQHLSQRWSESHNDDPNLTLGRKSTWLVVAYKKYIN